MKHIIYTDDVDTSNEKIQEYRRLFCDEDENLTDDEIIQRLYDDNSDIFECERENLSTAKLEHSSTILCVGILGLWNGRPMGYKLIKPSEDVSGILGSTVGDYIEFYADRCEELNGMDIQCRDSHHDGTNWYVFRELNSDPNEDENIDKMLCAIVGAGVDKERQAKAWELVQKHTHSLYPYVQKIYGWKDD